MRREKRLAAKNQYERTMDAHHRAVHSCDMRSLVSVVDDDESVRESLPDLLREFGFAVRAF